MCQRVTCSKCNRPTYAGCGAHIGQVLRDVPHDKRCSCREDKAKAKAEGGDAGGGFLRGLFSK